MPESSCLYNKNSRFRKDQLQQNRDQLQQRTLLGITVVCTDFISIGHVLSINTGELFPPAEKAQIREGGQSENIAKKTSHQKFLMKINKIIGNIGEAHELFITT